MYISEIQADSFEVLVQIAVNDFRDNECSEVVLGPITSGGLGSLYRNLEVFHAVMWRLKTQLRLPESDVVGYPVFNQMPYEPALQRLLRIWHIEHPDNPGENPILEQFYDPFFREVASQIQVARIIPRWETSRGTTWERNLFTELKSKRLSRVEFYDLPESWVTTTVLEWRAVHIHNSKAILSEVLAAFG
jgi:hypothetical protein